jgi:hypothetical protein
VSVAAKIQHDTDHLSQVNEVLQHVPPPSNPMGALYVWQKPDRMKPEDVNYLLSQSSDPELLSAVWHAPSAFPIGSPDARKRLLDNFNREHRAADFQMAQSLRDRIEAVKNFRDLVMRELKERL